MPDPDANTVFSQQLHLAWEHFKFHAEQRTRMFHFFLLAVALLLNAFSLLIRSEDPEYKAYAFVLLCIGGLLSTMFLSLDVRNTQLLEQSETLLRKIEETTLYRDEKWQGETDGGKIKLGIFSREAVMKEYVKTKFRFGNWPILRWIIVHNIKHKLSVRSIQVVAILSFWFIAYATTPSTMTIPIFGFGSDVDAELLVGIGWVFCLLWGVYAMSTPQRHLKWEQEALEARDSRNHEERNGSP